METDPAAPDPADRSASAVQRDHAVADCQLLDREFATFGRNQRAAKEARDLLADQCVAVRIAGEREDVVRKILRAGEVDRKSARILDDLQLVGDRSAADHRRLTAARKGQERQIEGVARVEIADGALQH